MTIATKTLDLTGVHRTVESWRRVAWLTTANGPEKYRQVLVRAERTLRTGELPPGQRAARRDQGHDRGATGIAPWCTASRPTARPPKEIIALPNGALADYTQVLGLLELVPWNGDSLHEDNPDGAVRTLPFGRAGLVTYLILDDQQRVDVLNVLWVG